MRPTTSYLICATRRSGSTLLCGALQNTGIAGWPEEYLWDRPYWSRLWGITDYETYLHYIIQHGMTRSRVFGAKVMGGHFHHFITDLSHHLQKMETSAPKLVELIFPHMSYIWIRRRDKIRQAVSYARALQSNIWKQRVGETHSSPPRQLTFDFQQIDQLLREIEQDEASWQYYFDVYQVKLLEVVYEDFVKNYRQTVMQILDFLNISYPSELACVESKLQRQADELSEEWILRYQQMKKKSSF